MIPFEMSPLEKMATLLSGGTPSKANPSLWNGEVPWLTPKDMGNWAGRTEKTVAAEAIGSGTRLAPADSSYVAVRGMSLHNEIRVIHSSIPLTFNQDIKAVVAKEGVKPRFLYFALAAAKPQLLSWVSAAGHGTGVLSTDRLKSVLVPDVSTEEQETITSLLGALDDKIELNRRTNETLEAMARAIFKDWFVDFGPTRAKMAMRGEDPQNENAARAPYLAPDLWSFFPDRLDDEGKPEGWKREPLGAHMSNFDSKRVPVSGSERAKCQGPYPYHGATGVMDHVDAYLFDGVYLLVGEDGSVVKENGLAFTQYVWGKIWVNNHAHVLQGKGSVSTEQLLLYFQHEIVTPYITGAVQLKLSQGRMNAMPFIFAGANVCEAFAATIAPFFAKYRANADESKLLTAMRDLLLPKLMSGEVRLKDAEREVGEAT